MCENFKFNVRMQNEGNIFDKISENENKKILYLLINYTFTINLLTILLMYDFSLDKYIYISKKYRFSITLRNNCASYFVYFMKIN